MPHILFYPPVCHDEYPRGRARALRPISRSHTASTPLLSSIHKQQLCLWLQTRQGTSEHNTKPFQTHRELKPPPLQLSQRLFFSHYFLVDPWLVLTPLQSAAVSEYDARCFLFKVLAALGFFIDRISKILTFPDCSWSESSFEVS